MLNYNTPSFEHEYKVRMELRDVALDRWIEQLFSINWWILVLITIIPWLIWWKYADRKRVFELLTYGFLVGITASLLDDIGANIGLWGYQYRIISFLKPALFPYDFSVLPVGYMFIYQYFSN